MCKIWMEMWETPTRKNYVPVYWYSKYRQLGRRARVADGEQLLAVENVDAVHELPQLGRHRANPAAGLYRFKFRGWIVWIPEL